MDERMANADGRGTAVPDAASVDWLRNPQRVFPHLFIRGIALRAGTLPCKARASRGRRAEEDNIN